MFSVGAVTHTKIEVKKSTFTSYLLPFPLFETYHDKLKQEHPKASHIIWAFRRLNEFGQIVEGSNDDGEPKGAAATPTLNVLRGESLINTVILTVRYFGGTKLGVGGMVRAYTASAKEVVNHSALTPFIQKDKHHFHTSYTLVKRYEHYFETQHIDYHDRVFEATTVTWTVALRLEEKKAFEDFVKAL